MKAPPTGATKLPKMMSGYPEGDEYQSLVDATAELYINLVRWAYEGEVVLITNEGDKGVNLNQPATLHFLSDEEEHEFVVTPLQVSEQANPNPPICVGPLPAPPPLKSRSLDPKPFRPPSATPKNPLRLQ